MFFFLEFCLERKNGSAKSNTRGTGRRVRITRIVFAGPAGRYYTTYGKMGVIIINNNSYSRVPTTVLQIG